MWPWRRRSTWVSVSGRTCGARIDADAPHSGHPAGDERPGGGAGIELLDAFISYSHAVDGKLAPALQQAMSRFARPWNRLRALRVFHDQASPAADPGLWSSIERALGQSRSLILLASPRAAQSAWVQREAQFWRDKKPRETLFIALTDGEIAWDEAASDFDWNVTTALPSALRGFFREEPRHIDLRWARTSEHLSLDDPRFRDGVAELAAPLHGRPKDELFGEDVRQHRRFVRIRRATVISLATLTLGSIVGASVAVEQRNTARAQTRLATSRQLAAQAVADRHAQLDRSLLLGLESLRTEETVEARSAVLGSVGREPTLRVFLHGVEGPIKSVAFSPDSKRLASGDGRRAVLWDIAGPEHTSEAMDANGGLVTSVAFSPDGAKVASAGQDGTVTLWDANTRRPTVSPLAGHEGPVNRVAFSPDGSTLASAGEDKTVVLWDVDSGRQVGDPLQGHEGKVLSLAFSPEGGLLASGDELGKIIFWDVDAHGPAGPAIEIPVGDYSQFVASMVFTRDGKMLISGGGGAGVIGLWDVPTRQSLGTLLGHTGPVNDIALSQSDLFLASASTDGTLRLWSLETRQPYGTPLGGHGPLSAVTFSPDDKWLASASDDGAVMLRDFTFGVRATSRLADSRSVGDILVSGVAFSPDGQTLATGAFTGITLWDARTREPIGEPMTLGRDEFVESVAFSRDGRTLASGVNDGRVILWDAGTRQQVGDPVNAHRGGVNSVAFSEDGGTLASAGEDGRVVLWNPGNRQQIGEALTGHDGGVNRVAFSKDGRFVASAGADGRVILWDTETRQQAAKPLVPPGSSGNAVRSMAFSPDGQLLATASANGGLEVWDLRREPISHFSLARAGEANAAVAFSPDGRTLASTGANRIVLWDVASRQQVGEPLEANGDAVVQLAFSPDGKALVSGGLSAGGTNELLMFWDLTVRGWQRRACGLANRNLSQAEWDRFVGANREYVRTSPSLPAGAGARKDAPAAVLPTS
jgi:WD40 repeat protein